MAIGAAVLALLALLAWFLWPSSDARPGGQRPGVDEAELEEAEREVQQAPDEDSVRDWGPGVQKPPPG
ncbi:MAG TPA: hypothetical protein VGQ25_04710 [Gemmatimonadales bacterium]|jgi:hypothetical protein|nr:hypothetical protein [Gemmatimonadales bacterium]